MQADGETLLDHQGCEQAVVLASQLGAIISAVKPDTRCPGFPKRLVNTICSRSQATQGAEHRLLAGDSY